MRSLRSPFLLPPEISTGRRQRVRRRRPRKSGRNCLAKSGTGIYICARYEKTLQHTRNDTHSRSGIAAVRSGKGHGTGGQTIRPETFRGTENPLRNRYADGRPAVQHQQRTPRRERRGRRYGRTLPLSVPGRPQLRRKAEYPRHLRSVRLRSLRGLARSAALPLRYGTEPWPR